MPRPPVSGLASTRLRSRPLQAALTYASRIMLRSNHRSSTRLPPSTPELHPTPRTTAQDRETQATQESVAIGARLLCAEQSVPGTRRTRTPTHTHGKATVAHANPLQSRPRWSRGFGPEGHMKVERRHRSAQACGRRCFTSDGVESTSAQQEKAKQRHACWGSPWEGF